MTVGAQAFEVLGDPVRLRLVELLSDGEQAAGELGTVIQAEFGISQPAVSQQLRVLRERGLARVRAEGSRRLYAIEADPLRDIDRWLEPYRRFWAPRLEALGTEVLRGQANRGRATRRQATRREATRREATRDKPGRAKPPSPQGDKP